MNLNLVALRSVFRSLMEQQALEHHEHGEVVAEWLTATLGLAAPAERRVLATALVIERWELAKRGLAPVECLPGYCAGCAGCSGKHSLLWDCANEVVPSQKADCPITTCVRGLVALPANTFMPDGYFLEHMEELWDDFRRERDALDPDKSKPLKRAKR